MQNIAFLPANITAKVGDTVTWTNKDFVAHTATDRARGWNFVIGVNKSASFTLTKAGSIDYICRFHPNMKGHITIAPN